MLTEIDFTIKTGYLICKGNPREQDYVIIQRQEDKTFPEYHFRCSPWATYIREDEIEVTVWGGLSDRRGIWERNGSRIEVGTSV